MRQDSSWWNMTEGCVIVFSLASPSSISRHRWERKSIAQHCALLHYATHSYSRAAVFCVLHHIPRSKKTVLKTASNSRKTIKTARNLEWPITVEYSKNEDSKPPFPTLRIIIMGNGHVEQHLQSQELSRRSKTLQWEPTTNDEMLKFWGYLLKRWCQYTCYLEGEGESSLPWSRFGPCLRVIIRWL